MYCYLSLVEGLDQWEEWNCGWCFPFSHWSRGKWCFPFSHWSRRKWLFNSIAIRREIGVSSFFCGMSYVQMTLTLRRRQKSSSLILHLTFRDKGSGVWKDNTPKPLPRKTGSPTHLLLLTSTSKQVRRETCLPPSNGCLTKYWNNTYKLVRNTQLQFNLLNSRAAHTFWGLK